MAATPWDDGQVFYSEPLEEHAQTSADQAVIVVEKFLRDFHRNNVFPYREELRSRFNDNQHHIQIDLDDLDRMSKDVRSNFEDNPHEYLPRFEDVATKVARAITNTTEPSPSMQVTIKSSANSSRMRKLGSAHVGKLVKIPGIIIAASAIKAKATTLKLQCRQCRNIRSWKVNPGMGGAVLPRQCNSSNDGERGPNEARCPVDPYMILPDKSDVVDMQTLKLQERPDDVPTGEIPRHISLTADRYLVDRVTPGSRCTITGIFSIFESKKGRGNNAGARTPYIRVLGIETELDGSGRTSSEFSGEEIEEFQQLASDPDRPIFERVVKSIAPSIFGSDDIKKAVACLLFGGSTKLLPDGMRLRGDINVLLLGDPGTAKSQILKFAERVAPIGVYTSGKGSSAAGLTASVVRDASSRDFYLEGGAMVLADGGIVCIDEFDKMRETDRVAIHEAMEQQTISVAKAGITTTLNSRTSVLAAANSVFGRWDDTKTTDENVEFQSTILSRFDLIFIVKDIHNDERDQLLAKHIMKTHFDATHQSTEAEETDKDVIESGKLKRFISYARKHKGPRLSKRAKERLLNYFVELRADRRKAQEETGKRNTIPITVRQLEALVRIAESLAKMELKNEAGELHVKEACHLFKVSTVEAALSGQLHGAEGMNDPSAAEELLRAEKTLKARLPIGSTVSQARILSDFAKQNYSEESIRKVLSIMLRRGELEHQRKGKVLIRVR